MADNKKIAAATMVMASATSLSRIAGLVRDIVVARLFGAGLMTDAFFMAFTIPNLLRRFFGEGSLTAAFVPIFSEVFHRRGEKEAQQLANRCITLLLLIMLIVVSLGVVLSPWIVQGIGYGFGQVDGKLQLTNQLNQIMFPYIGLVSMLALLTGILNVRGHFFVPSLSPFFLNLAMILSALTMGHLFSQPIYALAVGVLLGGMVQLLIQFPVLCRYKIHLRLDFNFRGDAHLRKIMTLMLPGIAGVAIYQINIIVTRLLASFLPEGSVSYLYYGQRLFEFPQGIFIVSLAQAALPMMSRQAAEDNQEGMRQSLTFAMTLITLITLPAIVGLIVCAKPIYSLFFLGGEFDLVAMKNTALALICYAPGLIFVGYSRIAAQTFYALKDTRTPVVISFWTLLVNLILGLFLMQFYGFMGLAIALTVASMFNAFMLLLLLQRKVGSFFQKALYRPVLKVLPGCLLMVLAVTFLLNTVDWLQVGSLLNKSLILFSSIFVGALIYLGCCYLFRVDEVRQGWQLLRRKG
ncbi:MAG: murein biosynthesis integral membrane protein MurJ [Desulfuromusa sp.]|jgi:putative peptidoglycan lipid II flippase|nr:murein biosynthesis integral membrane protein MurJ [Desulfuromusa sp.]